MTLQIKALYNYKLRMTAEGLGPWEISEAVIDIGGQLGDMIAKVKLEVVLRPRNSREYCCGSVKPHASKAMAHNIQRSQGSYFSSMCIS